MPKHTKGTRVTKGEVQEVMLLLDRGKAPLAIARETGISRTKVYRMVKGYRQILRQPQTPLQTVAFEMCQRGTHEFLEPWLDIGDGEKVQSEGRSEEVVYGRVSISNDALKLYYSLTLADRLNNPIQPRIVGIGEAKLFQGSEERCNDQIFPMVVQILTCWFCGETRRNWFWLDATDQVVGNATGFAPGKGDLKKFGRREGDLDSEN